MHKIIINRKSFNGEWLFANLTRYIGIGLILLVFGILLSLLILSFPSLKQFGLHFLYNTAWDPVRQQFGALVEVIGTVVTSLIAVLLAVPLSFGIAILIIEVLPSTCATILARVVEVMAGIPSIIYGMWGLFSLAPFLAKHVQPWLLTQIGRAHV